NLKILEGDSSENFSQFKVNLFDKNQFNLFFEKENGSLHFAAFTKNILTGWYIVTDLNISKYFFTTFLSLLVILVVFIFLFIMILKKFDENKETEIKPLIESLQKDSFTGIYNRNYLEKTVTNFLNSNKYLYKNSAFIILDIDNFKAINDNLGHSFGDYVILETAQKISDVFCENCTVSRMGGDEFAIFIEDFKKEIDVIDDIKSLLLLTDSTYSRDTTHIKISISLGITFIQKNKYDFINLYNEADCALYKSKKLGKNCGYISNFITNQHIRV
ncbi:MAG: GGDEF domain-containing protein, partial [Cetobacterium sp.]